MFGLKLYTSVAFLLVMLLHLLIAFLILYKTIVKFLKKGSLFTKLKNFVIE